MAEAFDVAVIGGGPGGYTAALYCARAGLSTVVFERLSAGGQMAATSAIENYPGAEIPADGFELGERMRMAAESFGARTEYAEVSALELAVSPKRVTADTGVFSARTVIYAAGAAPRELELPGERELVGRGVAYCALCDGMGFKGRTVAVAGGGNSAAQDALTLSAICEKVYLIHRRGELRASKSYLEPLKKAGNIELVLDTSVDGLVYGDRLTGLRLTDKPSGREYGLAVDGLFVAVGRSPETKLVSGQLELDGEGYIVADETTRTGITGVFAVGDVRTKPMRQIVTATADGAVASMFAERCIAMGEA